MKRSERITIIISVVVIVILAIFSILRSKPSAKYQPVFAPQGQLAPGFPKELILDLKAKLANSYQINYDKSLNQYTATFDSGQTLTDLYNSYFSYLPKNGWTIVNKVTKYPTSRGIYAKNAQADLSVAIIDNRSQRQVIVTYLVK